MRSRHSILSVCLALALALGLLPRLVAAPAAADLPVELPVDVADAVTHAEAEALGALDGLRPAVPGVRVALLSTGVDPSALPEALRGGLEHVWGARDADGLGTYAASVLQQLLEEPRIRSFSLYGGGRFHADRMRHALRWSARNAGNLDVVLLAFPSHEVLDPVLATMHAGEWDLLTEAIGAHPAPGQEGTVFGVALDGRTRARQLAGAPVEHRRVMEAFAGRVAYWNEIRGSLEDLRAAGVAVVAPAGDVGPGLQTVLGLASLPEVVTVAAGDAAGISGRSASGPGLEGGVKPDLAAPTGIVGLLPERSALAADLGDEGLLDASLEPMWDAGDPPTDARARLDTSVTSAAVVAATTGALRAEGVEDVAVQRGALTAASVPLDGTPVWRQGAGVLRGVPDAAFASSRPLALGHGDLGAEPDHGSWTTLVGFANGAPASADAALTSFAGVGPDGRTSEREPRGAGSPEVSVGVSERGVRIAAPVGDSRYEGGVFCGYTQVAIPGTGGSVDGSVTIDGVPADAEQIPTCLVKGTQLRAHGFYIHELPAEDLTFALLPALPEEASVLERPLMILPVNPLHTKLYTWVTDADGNADFPNIPPGYYRVRLFSDYGSPVVQTRTDTHTGEPVAAVDDLGANPSYESFDALVLSAVGWSPEDLKATFGEDNVEADKPTGGWWVDTGPRRIRVVLGWMKKMPGAAVTSRVIDLMAYEDFDFSGAPLGLPLGGLGAAPAGDARGWTFSPGMDDPDRVVAAFNPLGGGDVAGIASYPFNLTTPNYTLRLSLNFSYEVTNAAIVAAVVVGDEIAVGIVTPQGTFRSPTVGPFTPLGSNGVAVHGHATGLASFDFRMLPRGASEGTLYLAFVPSEPVQNVATLATASVDDVSMLYSTWQRTPWPATMHDDRGMGHSFTVRPNRSERQMSAGGCRDVASGGVGAQVCEDWTVLVHSPGDDAATFDLQVDGSSIVEAMEADGSVYADPQRGTAEFSSVLAFVPPGPDVPAELSVSLESPFRTNGRFWEQLSITDATLAAHPGPVLVRIVDKEPGRSSGLFDHLSGPMPVAPYVPFAPEAVAGGGLVLEIGDGDDPTPEVSIGLPDGPSAPAVPVSLPSAGLDDRMTLLPARTAGVGIPLRLRPRRS